ncbi:MAG TPA: sigma 54-interacting transcriptional regulator [Pyrinomonadaceae bacterium]|nr:sigma 54-interacting transcriptional regulator [Pyrinomonadaceae bacterium]
MTIIGNEGNSHADLIDDDQELRESKERVQETSPTRRSAAYHSDIELVGRSQAFTEMMKQADLVSHTDSPVWLTGEPCTSKEVVAAAIHHLSKRGDQPFVSIDCAEIPAELIEAQLFGQVTGAPGKEEQGRRGLLEQVDGGTVFLDEITQTGPSFQRRLMHLLQTGEIAQAGSNETHKVNVRVIAASSCDIEQEVEAGRFCKDLFNSLNAVSIVLPPLREHHEDTAPELSDQPEAANGEWVPLSEIEGRYVARMLEHTRGNKQAAARLLVVDRKTLDRMIKRHNIDCHHAKALRAKVSARG